MLPPDAAGRWVFTTKLSSFVSSIPLQRTVYFHTDNALAQSALRIQHMSGGIVVSHKSSNI